MPDSVYQGSWWKTHKSRHVVVVTAVTLIAKKIQIAIKRGKRHPGWSPGEMGLQGAPPGEPTQRTHSSFLQALRQLVESASHQGPSTDAALRAGSMHPLPGMDPNSKLPGEEQLLGTNHPGSTNSRYSELRWSGIGGPSPRNPSPQTLAKNHPTDRLLQVSSQAYVGSLLNSWSGEEQLGRQGVPPGRRPGHRGTRAEPGPQGGPSEGTGWTISKTRKSPRLLA